jgi:hypothetical protein
MIEENDMRTRLWLAALAFAVWAGPASAQDAQGLATERGTNPKQTVEGVVTRVDPQRNRVTIRDPSGGNYEFDASPDTIKGMKVGDKIEARRRDANEATRQEAND